MNFCIYSPRNMGDGANQFRRSVFIFCIINMPNLSTRYVVFDLFNVKHFIKKNLLAQKLKYATETKSINVIHVKQQPCQSD